MNTHYDDQGKKSRGRASWIIRELMNGWVRMIEAELDTEKAGETEGEARGHGDIERKRLGVWGTGGGEEEDEQEEARGEKGKGEGLVVWMGDFSKFTIRIATTLQSRALIEPTNAGQTLRRTIRKKKVTLTQSPATRSLTPRATTCTSWTPASY